ncbi:MAG TPA: isochorismatase family protein [Phycisphaerae bacterium]|nr:isochorismatase family protein [Phycisphaerae bacterium]
MPHVSVLESSLAALVVVDVQERMLGAVTTTRTDELVGGIVKLISAAKMLDIPILYTEQNPAGLGRTDHELKDVLSGAQGPLVKSTCSAWRDENFREALQQTRREHVILAGLEAHVCIQQTALDLLRVDYTPFVAVDAVGSRRTHDMRTSLARMRQAGVTISTVEALIFEMVERCDHPRFKDILRLVK